MATTEQALISNPIQSQSFPEIKEILFATDFSTASLAALPFAAAIARAFHSHVHLLHLVMPVFIPGSWSLPPMNRPTLFAHCPMLLSLPRRRGQAWPWCTY